MRRPRTNNSRRTTLAWTRALRSTTANTPECSFCVLWATASCNHSHCIYRITATTSRTPLTALPTLTLRTPRLPPPRRTCLTDVKCGVSNFRRRYVVRRRRYCDKLETLCASVWGWLRGFVGGGGHDKTKSPDQNDLKLGTVVVVDTVLCLLISGSKDQGSKLVLGLGLGSEIMPECIGCYRM